MNRILGFTCFLLLIAGCGPDEIVVPLPPVDTTVFEINVIHDEVNGTPVVLAGSRGHQFIVSYERRAPDGTLLDFVAVQDSLPIVMRDTEGNLWDIFGVAVTGSRSGEALPLTHSFTGYWFAFGAMYPGLDIYEGETSEVNLHLEPDLGWLIPTDHVFQSAGFNAIPALDFPPTISTNFSESFEFYVSDDDFVIGAYGGQHRAYPHNLLDWHEVINDTLDEQSIAISYCPLTGTGTIWNRAMPDGHHLFGVSGLLYNNNVIPFDRETESLWTQIDELCVNGPLIGAKPQRMRYIETSWRTWLYMYPGARVVSGDTGFDRDYTVYPYGDYKENHDFVGLPVVFTDKRLPAKERVHCVIVDGAARAFRFSSF